MSVPGPVASALRGVPACPACTARCTCDYCRACRESDWIPAASTHASLCDACASLVEAAAWKASCRELAARFLEKLARARARSAHGRYVLALDEVIEELKIEGEP